MDKSKILLVDDSEIFLRGWQASLESAGYAVRTALDGEKAITIVQEEKQDVVITDLVMPGMDGVEVCKKVKALSPETEVVLISGYPDEIKKHQLDFIKAGGRDEFLRKPLFEEEIIEAVKKILRESRR